MKIAPIAGPMPVQPTITPNVAARERAVAKIMGSGEQSPVQNQNAVSPEEISAIRPSNQQPTEPETTEAEQTPAETQPEEPKKTEDPNISRQFAQLARQEKQLRQRAQQQEQAIKAREAALAAREAELAAKSQQQPSGYTKDQIKQNFLRIATEAGVSYDEIVNQVLQNQTPQDPRVEAQLSALQAEIKALKDLQDQGRKAQEEQQTQAYQAAVQQIRSDVKNLIRQDSTFETVKAANAVNDVVELIETTYKEEGILLSVEEAAQQVEDYLVEEAMKLTRLEKIQKKLQASTPAASKPQQNTAGASTPKQPQPMKTLTNAASSNRQLSAKERAILAFKGELKT